MMKQKTIRTIALLLFAVVICAMLFSMGLIAVEAGHNCTGDGCVVCGWINTCQRTLNTLSCAVAAGASLGLGSCVASRKTEKTSCPCLVRTLAALKVRLSD